MLNAVENTHPSLMLTVQPLTVKVGSSSDEDAGQKLFIQRLVFCSWIEISKDHPRTTGARKEPRSMPQGGNPTARGHAGVTEVTLS